MQNFLVISFSDLNYDARVSRQVQWLKELGTVTVICFSPNTNITNVDYCIIEQIQLNLIRKSLLALLLLLKLYKLAYTTQHGYYPKLRSFKAQQFDWIIANDVESLPLAFRLNNGAKVFFDAHEYAPRHFEDKLWWKVLFAPWYKFLCKKYIAQTSAMTTVSKGLANEYFINFGIKPFLIPNATKYFNLEPSKVLKPIKLIHHGIINKSRKIETMIEVAQKLGTDYTLDLILMLPEYASKQTSEYFQSLKTKVKEIENVNILAPMTNDKIVPYINKYDIGIFLLEPVNFNYTYALPNKLFDFIQARLAIAIGPSLEMRQYVLEYDLGIVSKSFDAIDLAEEIKKFSASDIQNFKDNSHKVAMDLSEEGTKKIFSSIIANNGHTQENKE
ncbi:MAG: glycosyltransferase involved in cell wall biosynthesis [Roseivirga sp.]|jgi:glycosyltransferase involved in cell wall biosynthesis